MRRTISSRSRARLTTALVAGGLLILGPSAALAHAPAAPPAAPVGTTHGTSHGTQSGMHLCPSMNNDWL
ncbi:MAG: hypothetical protein ABI890_07755 [Lapillicoccus sp.]